jgi:hypothetical protein
VDIGGSLNLKRLEEERIESPITVEPLRTTGTIITVVRPVNADDPRLPRYRASLGGELRFNLPVLNIPLRFIVAFNPNAQRNLPSSILIAPERRVVFRVGFSRTL